ELVMTAATTPRLLTTADLLAMPDDGVRRWLINGQLREELPGPGEAPMTVRNRWHSQVMAEMAKILGNWKDQQPPPRGVVVCGEAGVRLRRDPETTVGVDVAYVSPEVAARTPDETSLIDGVPVLIGEILSPRTTHEQLQEKLRMYREAAVPL